MKTEASDYTVQFEISGSNALYAEDEILRLSGRRTDNNNLSNGKTVAMIFEEMRIGC
jgi:hypothetical protein